MRFQTFALVSVTMLLNGCPPITTTTVINTTKTDVTLQIHHRWMDDPRSAKQVIEVLAHASRPGPMFWNTRVDAILPDGSVLFRQDDVWPAVLTREYVGEDQVWFSTRLNYFLAIEDDGIYLVPVKYWDNVYDHMDEIRKRP